MPSYESIIAGTARQKLNLGRPRLLLCPPHDEIIVPEDLPDLVAWAKARKARGLRFHGTPVAEPEPKPRQPCKHYLRLRAKTHRAIMSSLPATINQLIASTGLSRGSVHNRLHELLDEGHVRAVRLPGRAPANIWHATDGQGEGPLETPNGELSNGGPDHE